MRSGARLRDPFRASSNGSRATAIGSTADSCRWRGLQAVVVRLCSGLTDSIEHSRVRVRGTNVVQHRPTQIQRYTRGNSALRSRWGVQEIAPSRAQTAWSPSGALAERPRILDPGDCRVETECTSTIALVHCLMRWTVRGKHPKWRKRPPGRRRTEECRNDGGSGRSW